MMVFYAGIALGALLATGWWKTGWIVDARERWDRRRTDAKWRRLLKQLDARPCRPRGGKR